MKAQRALLRGNPQHLLLVSINGEKREMLLQNGLTMFGYLAEATGPASARETIFRPPTQSVRFMYSRDAEELRSPC